MSKLSHIKISELVVWFAATMFFISLIVLGTVNWYADQQARPYILAKCPTGVYKIRMGTPKLIGNRVLAQGLDGQVIFFGTDCTFEDVN